MATRYHFLCKPIENIRNFESELNKLIEDGWHISGNTVPMVIIHESREPDKLFVTLTKESDRETDRWTGIEENDSSGSKGAGG